jgi:hypothetical protein
MGAHQSSATSRSGARELQPRGGGGEGRAGELNGGVTVVRMRWRGVSLTAAGSAMVVMAVELSSEGNERGRTPGRCEVCRVLRRLL